jgi:uncharacterized protein (DUF2235 family)
MALIAIFCDGTWNTPDQDQPTHVHRLFSAVRVGADQRPVYLPGVGTGRGWRSHLGRALDRIGGGAFGWGLNATIKSAYRSLAMQYRPGDRIAIFGFSRGAYTARSLAGMLRKVGMIERPTAARVEEAFALYRTRGKENHPDCLHIIARRRAFSPRFATSTEELAFRGAHPVAGEPDSPELLRIDFLGVWDTVGALGVPASVVGSIAKLWNRRYEFHDTRLSGMVRAARHAVALDERRVFYRPSLWDNLEQGPDDPGLNGGDRSADRPYQQVWFVGNHAILGGSAGTRELTSITLDWLAEGARAAGLELAPEPPLLDRDPDPLTDSLELGSTGWFYRLFGHLLAWRRGPGHPLDLHVSAVLRVAGRADYRPRSLRALMPELFGGLPIGVPSGSEGNREP